ncbi:MAG: phospholipase C, phosphocholine-specific [Acidobacteriia bacterium]|nr:phospholipase C, phosphocholine-specific [Terriglobia bacterium]
MSKLRRREFLKAMGSGAVAASLPMSISRALAIPANNRKRSLEDVEHIVIFTQENRSFDHYFGTMRGVRGFGDPRAVTLPSGKSVFHQPNGAGEVLPFRPNVASMGTTFLADVPHDWNSTHGAWNGGRHDGWIANKGVATMAYSNRQDLPYHFALADAFTVCDDYHCSVLGPTDPNRYHLWTGWLGNNGAGGGPVVDNSELGYDWSSFPERLVQAGITWKVYQDIGRGLTAAGFWGWTGDKPYLGNYGDNALLYLHQYQNAQPGNPLADFAKTGTNILAQNENPAGLFDIFRNDVHQGKLPQVSYIVAPEAYTEHPNWAPNFGAWYVSQFIDILTSNPDVFSKTALFLNYDEEGGFFDHKVPPTPPQSSADGLSTVSTVNEIFPGNAKYISAPYGLGMRVPMIVISPWSKGGWVNSQVFDHTSLIKFIEKRFGGNLIEPNITPWRRAVVGDLTSAFDFDDPDSIKNIHLPPTNSFKPADFSFHPDYIAVPPANQTLPKQEPGVRPARALPYTLNVHGLLKLPEASFVIGFSNTGSQTAVFQVRSGGDAHGPRSYTVEPGKTLTDTWLLGSIGLPNCDLSVHGPNGFFRGFKGSVFGLRNWQLDVRAVYNEKTNGITLVITNPASHTANVTILDQYSGKSDKIAIGPGGSKSEYYSLQRFSGWYDFVITVASDSSIEYHLAGHLETGDDSISDPALGGLQNYHGGDNEHDEGSDQN